MPGEITYGATPVVKIDGRVLPEDVVLSIEEVTVADNVHLPDMVEIRFRDELQDMIGRSGAQIGKEIEVSATELGGTPTAKPLFVGEITALETEFEFSSGSHAVLRGYDKSHRLMKNCHTRAWEQTDLATLTQTLAREAGVETGPLARGVNYEYTAQVNQTSWDFLQERAREAGCELVADLGTLELREPPPADSAPRGGTVSQDAQPLQLVLGTNLRSFRVRLTAAAQVQEASVRAWDWKAKEVLVGEAQAGTGSVRVRDEPGSLAAIFAATPAMSCDRGFESQRQVDAAAKALADLIAASHAEAHGVVDGNPTMKAGKAVSIANTGDRFDGDYVLTATRHVFDEEGFSTDFEITGRQERSVLGLTGVDHPAPERFFGVVVGIVTNNNDPEGAGRVKVKFPWLSEDLESGWARVATLDAGRDDRGSLFIPEVNDEVLAAFEHGDITRPYVIGSLWNGVDKPPGTGDLVDGTSGEVKRRELRSRLGHLLRFGDDSSTSEIEIVTADGNQRIHLDQSNKKITVTVGRSSVEITDAGNVTVEATSDITVKSQTAVTIEAGTTLTLKGPNVKVDGSAQTEIKGGMIRLN